MPVGNWIFEITSSVPGGGQPYVPPDAPPVTIGTAEVEEIYSGVFEVRVNWTKNAAATASNFTGVGVFLEDPDMSETALAPMDDTVTMDDTTQMAGKWIPEHVTDTAESPATFRIAGKTIERKIRAYLQAYNKVVSSQITRANAPNPTPNIQVTIPAARDSYQSGQEYTWLVTNPTVDVVEDFDNPNGPKYQLHYGYTPPDDTIPLPPGLTTFGGVQIVFEYPDDNNRRASERFLAVNHPETWVSEIYDAQTQTFNVYFCSVDINGRSNTPVRGVTPMVEVSIKYPPDGQQTVPPVTGFTLTNPRHEWQPDGTLWATVTANWTNPDVVRFGAVEFWRVGVVPPRKFDRSSVSPLPLRVIDWPTSPEAWTVAAISVGRDGKLADDPNNLSAATPTAIWNIGPPGTGGQGHEYTPQVTISGATVDTTQQLNSDGVVMMSHTIKGWINSTDNSFGGVSIARVVKDQDPNGATTNVQWWDAPKNATSIITDWEPAPAAVSWDFYFVARDQQGKRNTIVMGYPAAGTTPKVTVNFTPMAGDVLASRLPKDWFSEDEFSWPSAPGDDKFKVDKVISAKIYVGSILRVGGGTTPDTGTPDKPGYVPGTNPSFGNSQNGQIAVYNSSNVLRAWMGEQNNQGTPDIPSPHPVFGGWFAELYVGGDNPTNAPLYATQAGVVIVGGFDVQGSRYPYISIRNKSGIEVGRMGARVGQGQVGNESTIEGAWFREFAYGGQSFADWRMLARMDPSNPQGSTVEMRNISKFQIDYMANYPSATNPTNAAMTLLFGYDAFVADVATSTYYKFPGISMTRTGTGHQCILINRGIVLNMPSGTITSPVRAGAFVTYNGQQTGNDAGTFWTVLSMNSPTTHNANVELASGRDGGVGGSHFTLWDGSLTPVVNFNVDETGNVTVRGSFTLNSDMIATQYSVKGSPNIPVITTGGQFNGSGGVNTTGAISSSSTVTGSAIWANGRNVINSSWQFVGDGGVDSAGGITGASLSIRGHSQAMITSAGAYYDGTGVQVITFDGQFCGKGGIYTNGQIDTGGTASIGAGGGFRAYGSTGVTGPTTFTTADGKTVTVRGGIIISVV